MKNENGFKDENGNDVLIECNGAHRDRIYISEDRYKRGHAYVPAYWKHIDINGEDWVYHFHQEYNGYVKIGALCGADIAQYVSILNAKNSPAKSEAPEKAALFHRYNTLQIAHKVAVNDVARFAVYEILKVAEKADRRRGVMAAICDYISEDRGGSLIIRINTPSERIEYHDYSLGNFAEVGGMKLADVAALYQQIDVDYDAGT